MPKSADHPFQLLTSRFYCFNDGDDATAEWFPQGVSTVADAQADQQWGSKQAILVSWYSKGGKGVRVSFLDPATGDYQHVLLVYPYTNSNGNPSYEAVTTPQAGDGGSVHAGGIVWYGNYLYVADTRRGLRVFDMRRIFDIKSAGSGDVEDSSRVGRHDNKYYSYGYRYVMPQVFGYSHPGGLATHPADHVCNAGGPQKFSSVALDRSTTPDTLITSEYCATVSAERNGRVARYPMDGGSGLPAMTGGVWQATAAHRMPKANTQGAVAHEARWFLSRTGRGEQGAGYLTTATASGSTGDLVETGDRNAAIGVEDLSYWPGSEEIFTVTEYPDKRVVYGVTPPSP
ncbi:hypothetical protein ACFPM7_27555 [Actinokineospora guangxiensis]|uniref:LVIVD repeat-containing protein n=1 Tax=Actinokineospora guangxiensis TaxID=1490288 RepID=A0ABW0EXC1_9PSEU